MNTKSKTVSGLQGTLPLVLFGTSALVWCALAVRKLSSFQGSLRWAGITLCLFYGLWLLVESRVAAKEGKFGSTERDGGSLPLYAAARIATVTAALALPTTYDHLHPLAMFGLALTVLGACLRLFAIRTLGRFYSHYVRKLDGHRIVNDGPYRLLRHPAYTGMLLAHLGFVLFFFHPLALALMLGVFVPAVVFRILVEERSLYEIEGYEEFGRTRARLVPFVW